MIISTDKKKRTTIYDIAARVGTSTATVSRVLNDNGYPVSEEIRNKILVAVKDMNYTPNLVSRTLKKNESKDIGVIVPTISNMFYTQMVLGVETEAKRKGYNILLCNSFGNASDEERYIELLFQKQVEGVIISTIDEQHKYLKKMQKYGLKLVAFDQHVDDLICRKVGFDHIKAGIIAVEHLIEMGHKNIAFMTLPLHRRSRRENLEGYRLALLRNELEFKEENVIFSEQEVESEEGNLVFENGRNLVKKFLKLKDRPTAIFAVNDMIAIGIIHELINNGIRIPDDVSVVGVDNIEISLMVNPPLTTVNQPAFSAGKLAFDVLMNSSLDEKSSNDSITLEPTLVSRKSVKNINN